MEWGLMAFLVGVVGSFFIPYDGDPFYLYLVLLIVLCICICTWQKKSFRIPCIPLALCLVGVIRVVGGGISSHDIHPFHTGKQIISGEVIRDPMIRSTQQGLVVRTRGKVAGQETTLLAWTGLFPLHRQWEQVTVSCTVLPMKESRHGSFDGVCKYASVTTTGVGGNSVVRFLSELKLWFSDVVEHTLPEPHSGLFGSLLFGARSTLSRHLTEAFNTTGLTHIVAVSGYNITLLISILSTVLLSLGAHRKKLPLILGVGILFFTLFTGGSAATVRASIMGYLFVIAQWFGRRVKGFRLLLMSAAVMTAIQPDIVFDLGFQLSFLATLGLFVGASFFRTIRIPYMPLFIQNIAFQTISAMVFTTPLIFLTFGTISLIALVANILIVPVIPSIMIYGMTWMGIAIIGERAMMLGVAWVEPVSITLGWPLWLLLEYVIRCVESLSRIPFASISFQVTPLHWVVVMCIYVSMIPFFIFFQRKRRLYLK